MLKGACNGAHRYVLRVATPLFAPYPPPTSLPTNNSESTLPTAHPRSTFFPLLFSTLFSTQRLLRRVTKGGKVVLYYQDHSRCTTLLDLPSHAQGHPREAPTYLPTYLPHLSFIFVDLPPGWERCVTEVYHQCHYRGIRHPRLPPTTTFPPTARLFTRQLITLPTYLSAVHHCAEGEQQR